MKKTVISAILLFSISAQADKKIIDHSVTLANLSNSPKLVEINNEFYEIKLNSSLRISCIENEVVELLHNERFENLICGTKKELN